MLDYLTDNTDYPNYDPTKPLEETTGISVEGTMTETDHQECYSILLAFATHLTQKKFLMMYQIMTLGAPIPADKIEDLKRVHRERNTHL